MDSEHIFIDHGLQNIQEARSEFWDSFSNLKSLTITSDLLEGPVFGFIHKISKKCPLLENFHYKGYSCPIPELSSAEWELIEEESDFLKNYVQKMLYLKDLYVTFILALCVTEDLTDRKKAEEVLIQKFQIYFSYKCPKLNGQIQVSHNLDDNGRVIIMNK